MSKTAAIFAPIGVLLLILNALGGIISGIWLALIGQWWALGVGLAGLFVSHFLISMLLIPSVIFAAPAAALFERGKGGAATVMAGLSTLYTAALMAGWGIGVLYFFASETSGSSVIPLLIWSYGVASAPWTFLAAKDQQAGGNEYSAMSTFFFQIGYVVAIILVLVASSLVPSALVLVGAMGINWLLQLMSMRGRLRAESLLSTMAREDE